MTQAIERYAEAPARPGVVRCTETRTRAWVDPIVGDTCNAVLVDGWRCPFYQDHDDSED